MSSLKDHLCFINGSMFCVSYHFGQLTIKEIRFGVHRRFRHVCECEFQTWRRNVFPDAPQFSCVTEMSLRKHRLLTVVPLLIQIKLAAIYETN